MVRLRSPRTVRQRPLGADGLRPARAARRARGFSLIELIVAAAAVSLLVLLAAVYHQTSLYSARVAEGKVFLSTVARQIREYYIANGFYPRDVNRNILPADLVAYVPYWPSPGDDNPLPWNAAIDYEAWGSGSDYWIGVSWFGKNGLRDAAPTGVNSPCVTKGVRGQILEVGDDLCIEVDRNVPVKP